MNQVGVLSYPATMMTLILNTRKIEMTSVTEMRKMLNKLDESNENIYDDSSMTNIIESIIELAEEKATVKRSMDIASELYEIRKNLDRLLSVIEDQYTRRL